MTTCWGAKHKKALCASFDQGLANPENTGPAKVDPVCELVPDFTDIKLAHLWQLQELGHRVFDRKGIEWSSMLWVSSSIFLIYFLISN